MQLTRYDHNPILEKNPNQPWEAGSVFNPTVWQQAPGRYGMLYRATNDVRVSEHGGYMSSIGLAWSSDAIAWQREPQPLITPDQPYEARLGCEDPRITKIGDTYYIFYTAVGGQKSGDEVRIALATTKDFQSVTKHGIVGPRYYSKAGALFPEPIGGRYWLLWANQSLKRPHLSHIMYRTLGRLEDLHRPGRGQWLHIPEAGQFAEQEVGAVPIKTPAGWLLIYSGFSLEPRWTICAALLDTHDPRKIIGATAEPILLPETSHERTGVVNNVCFPEGALVIGEELYVYYGSGDQGICLATCRLSDLLGLLVSTA